MSEEQVAIVDKSRKEYVDYKLAYDKVMASGDVLLKSPTKGGNKEDDDDEKADMWGY